MNKVVSMGDMVPLMKEKLEMNGKVSFTPKGNSMLPMLHSNIDSVTLQSVREPISKYAVVLYCRDNGNYVLHRIVGKDSDGYIFRGDNQFWKEYGIREDQMIGVVTSFVRNKKEHRCDEFRYRVYCVLWVHTVGIRRNYRKIRRFAGRIKRKILGAV